MHFESYLWGQIHRLEGHRSGFNYFAGYLREQFAGVFDHKSGNIAPSPSPHVKSICSWSNFYPSHSHIKAPRRQVFDSLYMITSSFGSDFKKRF